MWRSWKLGTAFGIDIFFHWSSLLLPALIILMNWGQGGLPLAVYLLVLVLGIFGCVILHELGHALMARQFGIRTRDITLYPIGGIARLERMSDRPLEEICIALAGPAVNVVIAALLMGVLLLSLSVVSVEQIAHGSFGSNLLLGLMISNVFLAGFNLLPAFPMDGGRVLRALLAMPLGQLRATEIAARIGTVLAVVLGMLPLLTAMGFLGDFPLFRSPMLVLLAAFVLFAGQQELAALRYREAQRRAEVLEALPADEDVIDVEPAPRPLFDGFVWDANARVWVVWRNGRPVATFTARSE
ncbi:MAG TPA: site-2 protease family protein [Gemmataceae bacterium]|jgi:Zn-dependent protease|nr:site-2 protease family protein [Gemmataceae bacterium]